MWLTTQLAQHLRWSLRLYHKLFKTEALYTLAVVGCTLVNQVATLFAFFLPLKVIILIGSPTVPSYFPEVLAQFSRHQQVLLLGVGAVVSFLLHQLAGYLNHHYAEKGAERVVQRTRKLPLFSAQDDIARKAYQRLAGNIAAYVFVLLTLGLYAIIYPHFLIVVVGYAIASTVLLLTLTQCFASVKEYATTQPNALITWLTNMGFFIAFGFMAYDYLTVGSIGMIAAVISLLISRQLFQRIAVLLKESVALEQQRTRVDALFFHHQRLEQKTHQKGLLQTLLDPDTQHKEMEAIVAQLLSAAPLPEQTQLPALQRVRWHQTGIPDVMAFHLVLTQPRPERQWSLRLHVFSPRHHTLAMHESDLLLQRNALPSLRLHGVTYFARHYIHAFQVERLRRLSADMLGRHGIELYMRCWRHAPTEELIDRYQRTHPQLPEKLNALLPGPLAQVAYQDHQRQALERFIANLPATLAILKALPLVVVNQDTINPELVYSTGGLDTPEDYRITFWGRWLLEPIGCYLPLRREVLNAIPSALQRAAHERLALRDVEPQHVELAAHLHELYVRMKRQKYRSALSMLTDINSCMEDIQTRAPTVA